MEDFSGIDYKPGRNMSQYEQDGLIAASKTSYEARIMQLLQMIEVSNLLKKAKAEILQSQKIVQNGHLQ